MASISQEERARIIANNKSLRIIKNEMDQLLERGGITEEQYETLSDSLPAEASLRNLPASNSTSANNTTAMFGALSLADRGQSSHSPAPSEHAPPPAYANPTPPPPPPMNEGLPELCRVVALYRYSNPDPRDCDFEAGDQISVTSYANAEWWTGRNLRTNQTGIFPRNYIRVESNPAPNDGASTSYYGNNSSEKANNSYYQPPSQQQNPYASPTPPMAIANDQVQQQDANAGKQPSKVGAMGKKFGSKLGNAAIFGAGATMGADLVNSIF